MMCRGLDAAAGSQRLSNQAKGHPKPQPKGHSVSHNVAPTHLQPFTGSSCPASASTAARCWVYWDAPAADSGLTAAASALWMPGQHRVPVNSWAMRQHASSLFTVRDQKRAALPAMSVCPRVHVNQERGMRCLAKGSGGRGVNRGEHLSPR